MAETIVELLVENDIRMKRMGPGAQEHVRCPRCEGGRSKELSLSVRVDPDGEGATWNCKRGSCGWSGGGKLRREDPRRGVRERLPEPMQRTVAKPPPHTPEQQSNRPPWLWEFFDERNIGPKTVQHFGVYAARRRFPDPVGESDCIVFPLVHGGEVVNRKYRPHPAKNPMLQEREALPTLFNADALGEAPEEVFWVEGEPDVMAMHEAGYPVTVSLKDGAPAKVSDDGKGGKRFDALETHAAALSKVRRFFLAGDTDEPGLALREELARRLGRHRCWLVDWPEGCKDACDVLRFLGPDDIRRAIEAARPYPIAGVRAVAPGVLVALRNRPRPPVMRTGIGAIDQAFRIPADGRLIVVTGYPASGKTSFIRFLMVLLAQRYERRWLVYSPEMQPWESFVAECAESLVGKPFWGDPNAGAMSEQDIVEAEHWLGSRVWMLESDSEDHVPSLDWVLERARYAALAFGITDMLIDPWNELENARGEMSETDFIGRGLQRCKAASKRHGFNVWIIAHPAKPPMMKPGEKLAPPGPYQISGSSHWANKTDFGLTVHQPDGIKGASDIVLWKARYARWGSKNTTAKLNFDPVTGRYSSLNDDPQHDFLDTETGRP